MIIVAQIFSVFLGSLVITKSYADWRRGRESLTMFLFWTATWLIIIVIAFYPNLINILIVKFGGQRTGLGTVFGLSLTFLFFVMYRIYIKVDRVDRELRRLVKEMAIKDTRKGE